MKKILFMPLAAIALLGMVSCGDDDKDNNVGYDPTRFSGEAPEVVSTVPAADAVDVDTLKQIIVNYNKEIYLPPHATLRINGEYIDSGLVANGMNNIFFIVDGH